MRANADHQGHIESDFRLVHAPRRLRHRQSLPVLGNIGTGAEHLQGLVMPVAHRPTLVGRQEGAEPWYSAASAIMAKMEVGKKKKEFEAGLRVSLRRRAGGADRKRN